MGNVAFICGWGGGGGGGGGGVHWWSRCGFLLDWSFWMAGGVSSGFYELEGEVKIDDRAVRYCAYVEF